MSFCSTENPSRAHMISSLFPNWWVRICDLSLEGSPIELSLVSERDGEAIKRHNWLLQLLQCKRVRYLEARALPPSITLYISILLILSDFSALLYSSINLYFFFLFPIRLFLVRYQIPPKIEAITFLTDSVGLNIFESSELVCFLCLVWICHSGFKELNTGFILIISGENS